MLIRRTLCWIFAITSLQYLTISVKFILHANHLRYAPPSLRNLLIDVSFPVLVAGILGVAWWTTWKRKSSARVWAIAGSLMYILIFLRQFIIPLRPVWDHRVGVLFIGIVGLVAFLWHDKQEQVSV